MRTSGSIIRSSRRAKKRHSPTRSSKEKKNPKENVRLASTGGRGEYLGEEQEEEEEGKGLSEL